MGWRVTSLPRIVFVISKKEKYIWRSFQQHKPAQIEHKRMTPVLCDLDELGWRVTSQPPVVFLHFNRTHSTRCTTHILNFILLRHITKHNSSLEPLVVQFHINVLYLAITMNWTSTIVCFSTQRLPRYSNRITTLVRLLPYSSLYSNNNLSQISIFKWPLMHSSNSLFQIGISTEHNERF